MGRKKKQAEEAQSEEKIEIPTELKSLRYDFTAVETHEMAMRLSKCTLEIDREKELKKATAKQHDAIIKPLEIERTDLSNKIQDGWEYRDVECEVFFNTPTEGIKTYKRKDTGASFTAQMEDHEWNLFNQRAAEDIVTEDIDAEFVDEEGDLKLLPAEVPEGDTGEERDEYDGSFPKPSDPNAYNPPANAR
ncbi:MAG: hypothetical protein ACTHLE_04325 [Agriterribacter sp.]